MRNILNRMGDRLKKIQKGKPLKTTKDTDAIFDNVAEVKPELKQPDTLEISVDTKAKVNEGEYSRGGKKPDGLGRRDRQRLGSRPAAEAEVAAVGNPGGGTGRVV